MAIRKIAKMGHPVLRRQARRLTATEINGAQIQRLIDDMLETVEDEDGAGLAAPQIHESKRIVVLRIEEEYEVWINPELTPLTDECIVSFEGCLSIPGMRAAVARPSALMVEGLDRKAKPFRTQLEGYPAVVAQHECDHLDGILYVDRALIQTLSFNEEYRRYNDELWDSIPENEE